MILFSILCRSRRVTTRTTTTGAEGGARLIEVEEGEGQDSRPSSTNLSPQMSSRMSKYYLSLSTSYLYLLEGAHEYFCLTCTLPTYIFYCTFRSVFIVGTYLFKLHNIPYFFIIIVQTGKYLSRTVDVSCYSRGRFGSKSK